MSAKPIEIEDYYDKVHRSAWTRRSSGLLGGALLGLAIGATVGAVAAFLPFIFSALGIAGAAPVAVLPTFASVVSSIGLFAGVVGVMASGINALVGSESGAVSAGLAEKEAREKHRGDEPSRVQLVPANLEKPATFFSFKKALFTVPLFAGFGALLALHPATAPAVAALGFQGATATALPTTAAIAASATMFGMWGMVFSMPMSYLSNKAANLGQAILSEKLYDSWFKGKESKSPEIASAPEVVAASEIVKNNEREINNDYGLDKNFSSATKRFSLENVLEKNATSAEALTVGR